MFDNSATIYPCVEVRQTEQLQLWTKQTLSIKKHHHCLLLSNGTTSLIECNLPCKYGRPIGRQLGDTNILSDKKRSTRERASIAKYKRLSQRRKTKQSTKQATNQNKESKMFLLCYKCIADDGGDRIRIRNVYIIGHSTNV